MADSKLQEIKQSAEAKLQMQKDHGKPWIPEDMPMPGPDIKAFEQTIAAMDRSLSGNTVPMDPASIRELHAVKRAYKSHQEAERKKEEQEQRAKYDRKLAKRERRKQRKQELKQGAANPMSARPATVKSEKGKSLHHILM